MHTADNLIETHLHIAPYLLDTNLHLTDYLLDAHLHIADYLLDTTNKRDYLLKTHQHIADYLLDSFAYRKLSTIGTFAYCGLHIRLICISLAYFLSKIMQIQSF